VRYLKNKSGAFFLDELYKKIIKKSYYELFLDWSASGHSGF
jgi:hypothetical protein